MKPFNLTFSLLIVLCFSLTTSDAGVELNRSEIWQHYKHAHKLRLKKQYQQAFKEILPAYKSVLNIRDKKNYFRIYWEYIILHYLINQTNSIPEFHHKTLHIIIKKAAIQTVYDHIKKKIIHINPIRKHVVTDKQIEYFKRQAAEFDLILTALSMGKILYTHQILVLDAEQQQMALRHIAYNWYGVDIYLYTTLVDTITPSLTPVFRKNYNNYDTFSLVLPNTLKGPKGIGLSKGRNESDIMEGGITPQGLPIVPYMLKGDTRGFFLNNIDTGNSYQLMHEYFHMIESVLDTGYPVHAWLTNVKGPAGITGEMEYYDYIYKNLVNNNLRDLLFLQKFGSRVINNTGLYKKAQLFLKKKSRDKMRIAYSLFKMGNSEYIKKALTIIPDHPHFLAAQGGLLRYQGKNLEAYRALIRNADLDTENLSRYIQLAWLLDNNLNRPLMARGYYQKILKSKNKFPTEWKYYIYTGMAKAAHVEGKTDEALKKLKSKKMKIIIVRYPEYYQGWSEILAKIYFENKQYGQAKKHLSNAKKSKTVQEYLYLIDNYYQSKKITVAKELKKSAVTQKDFSALKKLAKSQKSEKNKLEFFLQATNIKPDNWESWFWLARTYQNLKQYHNAAYCWKKMKTLSKRPIVRDYYNYNMGLLYWRVKSPRQSGPLLTLWGQSRLEQKKGLSNWHADQLVNYYDVYMNNSQEALKYARIILQTEKDHNNWYRQKTLIWCMEKGFKITKD